MIFIKCLMGIIIAAHQEIILNIIIEQRNLTNGAHTKYIDKFGISDSL